MALLNSMLNIMPYNCRYCMQGYKALLHVSEEGRLNSVNVIELPGPQAAKSIVWDTLASMDPIFVNGFGHGSPNVYTGDSELPIFTSQECDILANRVVYLLSCLTAIELGPAIIKAGGMAYGGYNIAWTWLSEDVNADPYDLYAAEGFYRSSNEFPIALLQGADVGMAEERCLAEYNRWINIWETERSGHESAAAAIKWLIHDRDGLTVLGNKWAIISAVGIPSSLVVDVEPPPFVYPGDSFEFQGRLLDRETSLPLPGREVELSLIGETVPLATILTDSNGNWAFDVLLPSGAHSVYTFFPGNDNALAFSPIFRVEVGSTLMEVVTPPQPSVELDEPITFSGRLIVESTMQGLPGKAIELIGAEGAVATTITDENGYWELSTSFSIVGRYKLYAQFPGDPLFLGSKTGAYRVAVGLMPFFGHDGIGNIFRQAANSIKGTTFLTRESGWAKTIVVWVFYSGYASARMKCALYRRSDLSLVGVTEEREFLLEDGVVTAWRHFIFTDSPRLEVDTKYVLVAWASNDCSITHIRTDDLDQGLEGEYMSYDGFPDPANVDYWGDKKFGIYCEYVPDEAPPTTRILTIEMMGYGTTDPTPGSWEYDEGSQVQVSAIPIAGWQFDHWEGDVSGTANPITFVISQDMLITAVFTEIVVPPEEHSVSISVIGQGTTDPPVGSYTVPDGESMVITAFPTAGWEFDRWEGSIASTENPVTVQVFADMSIVAVFTEVIIPTHIVTIGVAGQGTTDPAPGAWEYEEGDQASITAIPAAGWRFVGWEGDIPSTENPLIFPVILDVAITAVFEEIPPAEYVLTIEAVGQGTTVPVPGTHIYEDGSLVGVSAIPDAGWQFDHWEGDISSMVNPIDILITSDMLIRAVFTEVIVPPKEHVVTIFVVGQGTTDPAPGTYSELDGTIFTITAIPAAGWLFDHWEGGISGHANPVEIEILADISIVAVFVEVIEPPPPPKPRWIIPALLVGIIAAVVVVSRGKKGK